MRQRRMSLNELGEITGISINNLSLIKTGKGKAMRFSTLKLLCEALECEPADILEYAESKEEEIKPGKFIGQGRAPGK